MAIERLCAKDYEEFIDFIDQVFSQDLIKVHFQEDMKYLYAPDDAHMQFQYAYRGENGRIRATVGVVPYTYKIGNEMFEARTVTNVTTHYRYTGKGYMQQLLKTALDDMKSENADFAVLHGNRERYRFWGFEMAGISANAYFEDYNIPNRVKMGEKHDFKFEEMQPNDTDRIQESLEMYNREPQHYVRHADTFIQTQSLWNAKTYAVLNCKNEFCGYLNYSGHFSPQMQEIFLHCPQDAARVIYSFMQYKNLKSICVSFSPFHAEMNQSIYEAAESVSSGQTTRLNILRPERFIAACLEVKRLSGAYMPQGKVVVESIFGKMAIKNDGNFTVEKTDAAADIKIDKGEIYSFLFGPETRGFMPYSNKIGALSTWFPMPFYIHRPELY